MVSPDYQCWKYCPDEEGIETWLTVSRSRPMISPLEVLP